MKRVLAPIAILFGGLLFAAVLIATGPQVEPQPPQVSAPLVRVLEVEPKTVLLHVTTYGTVVPRTESELIPEVSGRVTWRSPALVSGGFFGRDDALLRIDPIDYEVALEERRAALARAQSELADARKDSERQVDLARRQATSDAQRDDAANRLRVAEAVQRQAIASLRRARRDLERTEVTAPYDGRVRSERVDVGQFVTRGNSVATIYAVDYAEVRLPIPDHELAFLALPLGISDVPGPVPAAPVILRARFAGAQHEWRGRVVRTEGELDPRTRMVNVVARVADPYKTDGGGAPLSVGLFVEAEILGTEATNIVVLPRAALRGEGRVLVVDAEERLHFRDVDVLRLERDEVLIRGGLARGERVCISPLEGAVDGMRVHVPTTAEASVPEADEEAPS